jgi:hypothetical protein
MVLQGLPITHHGAISNGILKIYMPLGLLFKLYAVLEISAWVKERPPPEVFTVIIN